jgi:hypothetical protein
VLKLLESPPSLRQACQDSRFSRKNICYRLERCHNGGDKILVLFNNPQVSGNARLRQGPGLDFAEIAPPLTKIFPFLKMRS